MTKHKRRPDRLKLGKRNQLWKGSTHFNWNHFLTELVSGSYYFAPSLWPWITVQFLPLKPHLILSFSNAFYFQKSQEEKKSMKCMKFSQEIGKNCSTVFTTATVWNHTLKDYFHILWPCFLQKEPRKRQEVNFNHFPSLVFSETNQANKFAAAYP